METAEMIIDELESKLDSFRKSMKETDELLRKLKSLEKDSWAWITVKKAAEIADVSTALIYNKVNSGDLETKRISSKTFVKKSEIEKINDAC